eukprot:TRINITY_DN8976_c0_g1_i2.p1 TRINITY_DN8976_c0_g1~~TRINITY_DN8976_c0_g1_i2.p1  ORF type:complete len:187 (-),score=68.38 TRINITY_DN8976_c0_g1_i2:473-1033(-)
MGYAGYAPGANSKMAEKATDLQQALKNLPVEQAQETLEILDKLIRNVVRNPTEEKFRTIKLGNPKIAAAITNVPGAVEVLQEMGFKSDGENMVLPAETRLVHEVHVVDLINAKDHYKKEEELERKRAMRARKDVDADTEALRQQLELDRKEKDADGPVMHGSKPKDLGTGQKMTAGDIGIGKSSGG